MPRILGNEPFKRAVRVACAERSVIMSNHLAPHAQVWEWIAYIKKKILLSEVT
jgi:hypothetical protein